MAISQTLQLALANQLPGQIPDIAGGFQRGQEQRRVSDERDRQTQSRTLQGRILQGGLVEGSDLSQLAGSDPAGFSKITEALGFKTGEEANAQRFGKVMQQFSSLARTNPAEALAFAKSERDRFNFQGVATPQMDQFIIDYQINPEAAVQSVNTIVGAIVDTGGL
jgi:hypothetical protein